MRRIVVSLPTALDTSSFAIVSLSPLVKAQANTRGAVLNGYTFIVPSHLSILGLVYTRHYHFDRDTSTPISTNIPFFSALTLKMSYKY